MRYKVGQLPSKGKRMHKSPDLEDGQRRQLKAGEEEHNQMMLALSNFKVVFCIICAR